VLKQASPASVRHSCQTLRRSTSLPESRITLTRDHALVLFEFLARWEESGLFIIEHSSEGHTLEAISCELVKMLVEPFGPNYRTLLDEARCRVLGHAESELP
jgi:hypothetical protein